MPYLLDITGIRFYPRNFKTSCLFTAFCESSLSTRSDSGANHECKDVDISRKTVTALK